MKTIKKIIVIILLIQMILISPLSICFDVENKAYATAASFTETLESELFKQTIIPILITSGIVFKSKEAIDQTVQDVTDWLNDQGFDWRDPDDPDPNRPNLSEILKTMLKGTIIWSAAEQLYKDVIKIPDVIRDLIKHFVDENYDEGENIEEGYISNSEGPFGMDIGTSKKIYWKDRGYAHFSVYRNEDNDVEVSFYVSNGTDSYQGTFERYRNYAYLTNIGSTLYFTECNADGSGEARKGPGIPFIYCDTSIFEGSVDEAVVYGVPDIVDNPDYDWNNNYTNEKHIPIPIKSDIHGNPAIDENGFYLPINEPDIWIDVEPEEIPELNPSGIPQTMPEDLPEIDEDPEDDDGKILVFLKNIFNKLTGIRNDTATISENITQTGTGSGGIGDGIGDIPTDFDWGDFRHFFDIFFIFIYFIVILILIILKFLQIVFLGMPTIPANADLLTQYPTILAGVNYIKNLQVGGLTITVHQAFEFVFMIFFYIFIIKQIRKLYKAYVYEESSQNVDYRKDMKMDYYDRNNKPIGWNDTPEQAERRRNIKLKPPNQRFNEDIEWDDWGV